MWWEFRRASTAWSTKMVKVPTIICSMVLTKRSAAIIVIRQRSIPLPQNSFPHSSDDKESTCNAGDLGSIPGLRRSAGEGIGYPLQYCWSSLVAQLVKNLPAMRETWVWSLGWENPLEKGKATHSSILAWRMGSQSQTWWSNFHFSERRVTFPWRLFPTYYELL